MIRKIRKRDGTVVDFNPVKITDAIWKAAQAVGGKDYKKATALTDTVIQLLEKDLKRGEIPTVEHVQDVVEKALIEDGHAKTAKAYILYRKQHQDLREIGGLLKDIDVVDDYLGMLDWKVNENSNMSYSLQGLNVYATESIISHYWLNKIYPPEIGEAHTKGDYHIHDLGTLGAYTYFGKETVIIKNKGKIQLTSFQRLYEDTDEDEILLSKTDDAWAKYPKDLQVLDIDGWTPFHRVVKKAKKKQMRFLKNEGGRSVIVTEDHPMVMGTKIFKKAKDVTEQQDKLLTVDIPARLKKDQLFYRNELYIAEELYNKGLRDFWAEGMPFEEFETYSTDLTFNGIVSTSNNADSLPNKIELTEDLGYFVGFYLAEGWMEPHRLGLHQKNNEKNKQILQRITHVAYKLGCRVYTREENQMVSLRIANSTLTEILFKTIFNLEGISKDKCLPTDVLMYNRQFAEGLISGILDGDGSLQTSKTALTLRTASRTMLEQFATLMQLLGFTPRDRNLEGVGSTRVFQGKEIIQQFPLFGVGFRTTSAILPSLLYASAKPSKQAWRAEGYGWHKVLKNEPTEILDDYIYDITTESSTLVVNGMWNHNCVGWDLQDLLKLGFRGVSGKIESKPAKHFSTAMMQIVNYLYTLQGEAAGAQALSNFDSLLAPFVAKDQLHYDTVKQEMQKFLFNMNVPTRVGFQSLAPGEPVVIRKNGKVKVELIGKLVEESFGKNRKNIVQNVDGYGTPSPDSYAVPPVDTVEVISFNRKGEVRWLPVKAFIKHRVQSHAFKRIRTGSGEVIVSPAHSLFQFTGKTIQPVEAQKLQCAAPNGKLAEQNHVVAVNTLSEGMLGNQAYLDLFDLIEELPDPIRRRIFIVSDEVPQIQKKILALYGSLKEFLYQNGRYDRGTLYDGFKKNALPFDIYRMYSDGTRKEEQLYIKPYNQHLYNRFLKKDALADFVRLTAWFISEGKASHSNIVISQRMGNIKPIIAFVSGLRMEPTITESRGYSTKEKKPTETVIANVHLSGLYAYVLPYIAGASSREKTVPSFIYSLTPSLRALFIDEIMKGDGYYDQGSHRFVYSSMSDKLLASLALLCIDRGWRVRAVSKSQGRAGSLLLYPEPRRDLPMVLGDTAGVPVYEIEDYDLAWDWEYDISVDCEDDTENFAGSTGLLFYHNSPFTNITMDLTVPSYFIDEPAIVGGLELDNSYTEYTGEMDMINRAFAEIMYEGDAKGRPFTFPIPTYNITKDFNWENDSLSSLWDMTAKYGIPYFSNFINSDMKPDDARSMCCRLRLDNRELKKRGGGLFGANPKTGSIGVVTLNMPRIGHLAKNEGDFFDRLDKLMMLARQSLEIKRDLIENLTDSGLHPYSRFYLSDVKKNLGEYWKNHFSTIGLIGMNDALLNFMNTSIGTKEGKAFAEKVLDYMRKRILEYQDETGNLYNLEATPGEGTSYRLSKIDRRTYPDMRIYNQEVYSQNRGRDVEPYYTNSTQLPVGYTTDVFEALDLQDSLQAKYTGGTVLHIYVGEADPSPTAVKKLVRTVAENYTLPYYTITPTFSVCPDHGYISGEHQLCPRCASEQKTTQCEVYSRVVGYIRPVNQWNKGKQQEFRDRRTFTLREKMLAAV